MVAPTAVKNEILRFAQDDKIVVLKTIIAVDGKKS